MSQSPQITDETANNQLSKQNKQQGKQDEKQKKEDIQFANPICKQTYKALSRIYGKKKKIGNTIIHKNPVKTHQGLTEQTELKHIENSPQFRARSTQISKKQRASEQQLKYSKHTKLCSRKTCSCHKQQQMLRRMERKKISSSTLTYIRLPSIQKFQLEDLESKHKVSMQGVTNGDRFGKSGLEAIREQLSQKAVKIKSPDKVTDKNEKKLMANFSNMYKMHISGMKKFKNKSHKFKPKINNLNLNIEDTEVDEQQNSESQGQKQKNENMKKYNDLKKQSSRYNKTEKTQQHRNSKSIYIESEIFHKTQKQITNFTTLNSNEKNFISNPNTNKNQKRKPSILSNGLFRIPNQSQYAEYLRNYIVMNKQFNLTQVLHSSNFQVITTESSVYFGECDEEGKKCGKGIQVSQKDIFQGTFLNDLRSEGYQRNIDGVYIGSFKNGLRSGLGIFHWNNGEIFEGNWVEGMKNGHGVWKSPKGDSYDGDWQHNRQHGKGIFIHRSSTYKGQFKNFLKDGYGEQIFQNGDIYKGLYQNGKPEGKGRYQWKDGSYYQGQFVHGMREGIGIWVDIEQTKYQGSFKQDFKHGYGVQTDASGSKFEGIFAQGKRVKGKLQKNGKYIQIQFQHKKQKNSTNRQHNNSNTIKKSI